MKWQLFNRIIMFNTKRQLFSSSVILCKLMNNIAISDSKNGICKLSVERYCTSQITGQNTNIKNEVISSTNKKNINPFIIRDVVKSLHINEKKATKLVLSMPEIKYQSEIDIDNIFDFLKNAGIKKLNIIQNSWLLKNDVNILRKKLFLIEEINININELLILFKLDEYELKPVCREISKDFDNANCHKINYLAERLQSSVPTICSIIVKHTFIAYLNFDKVSKMLDLFEEYDMSPKYILNDPWIFRCSVSNTEQRLQILKAAGIEEIKPWMIRASKDVLSKKLNKHHVRKQIMGTSNNIATFLSEKFQMDKKVAEYMIKKNPKLMRTDVRKINAALEILSQYGYLKDDVSYIPKICNLSINTLKQRLHELDEFDEINHPARVLVSNAKFYKNYLQKLKNNLD